jgi:hypothetical protein
MHQRLLEHGMAARARTKIAYVRGRSAQFVRLVMTNTILLVTLAIAAGVLGFLTALKTRDFQWFARSGAIVTAFGVILISQAALLSETVRVDAVSSESGISHAEPDHYEATDQPVPEWVKRDIHARFAAGVVGPLLSTVGTVIWGFGDLLNLL